MLKRVTEAKRMRAKLHALQGELLRRRHLPIPEQGRWLASVLRGHCNYYAVPANSEAIQAFQNQATRQWHKALRRRSQRSRLNWERMHRLAQRWLPPARITHPPPSQRFNAEPKPGAQCASSARWDLCGGPPEPTSEGRSLPRPFGHVRQLDRVLDQTLKRAWAAGGGPGDQRLVIDIDSFIGEVCGYQKQGAGYGYTRKLGYHPLLATRAGSGEVLHIRNRKGQANTQRGQQRFLDELLARVRRAGATGTILVRADSGFENKKVFMRLDREGVQFSIGVKLHKHVRAAIDQLPEDAWKRLEDYPDTGEAQIAETTLGTWRLVVRRVRTLGEQQQLFDTWQHFAFATNRAEPLELIEAEHREHAVVELAIRDLKDQALAHFPSGRFHANSAWCVIAALAHNLGRWSTLIGLPDQVPRTARTRRRRLFEIPGRLTRSARQWTLHMPARWPWRQDFDRALERLRALPALA